MQIGMLIDIVFCMIDEEEWEIEYNFLIDDVYQDFQRMVG